MAQLRGFCKKIILMVIMISIIMGSCAVPNSYAKLTIKDGEFYYAGTTKGSYVPSEGIFSWLFDILAQIASFLLALIPNVLRMAFVGYAAGGEKLLTWALESTSGVNAQGEDINATDLTALSNSTNNVTVQAIVYNMLPALNVNFFDVGKSKKELYIKEIKEKDASGTLQTKKVVISPTGQQLNCKKCGKSVLDCCGELEDDITEIKCYAAAVEGKNDCGCNGCDGCKKYAQLMAANDPIIVQLKTLVAVWYYLIRLLAVAAMAVVLIAIGIKMAISTIASDKAVFKRMLVDWVVGVILIFTMHYIMYFAININETLVNIVRESANAVNKVQLAELADTKDGSEVEKSNQDIEIDVYEEIRTRAYDMKMTVGLVGMIMYITMVFMAFKYTLIYIKRWLTLAVLTLMAPGIGVAYALQKTLSGKSSSLKTWLTEYILNLVIQVVHALIYAIFISAALAYSLQNVSGVIIALIIMNFSLKAEGIFRRIFNLDPGNKGLLGSTETAGDKDKLMKQARSVKGMMLGANPVSKALTFPTRAIVGTTGKFVAAEALSRTAKAIDKRANRKASKEDDSFDSGEENNSNETNPIKPGGGGAGSEAGTARETPTDTATETGSGDSSRRKKISQKNEDKELRALGEEELQKRLQVATEEYEKDPHNKEKAVNVLEANRRLERYRTITLGKQAGDLTLGGVVAGHVKGVFDINNYFDVTFDKNGNRHYEKKPGLVFGNRQYNPETGRFEKDNSNAAYTQLGASKLLGFTKKDKEIFKQQVMSPALKGVGGMAAMFMGMGTFVGHPVVGMGLLAGGAVSTGGMVKKFHRTGNGQGRLRLIHGYRVQGSIIPYRLKFGSFDTPTVANMRSKIVMQANKELADQLTRDLEHRRPGFVERLRNGEIKPATVLANVAVPTAVGLTIGTISLPAGIIAAGITKKVRDRSQNKKANLTYSKKQDPKNGKYENRYDPYGYEADSQIVRLHPKGNSALDIVDSHHFKQLADQRKVIDDETNELIGEIALNKGKNKGIRNIDKFNKQVDELLEKENDEETQIAIMAALGFVYDPKTGTKTSITDDIDVDKEKLRETIDIVDESGNIVEHKITDQDVKRVNEALNDAIITRVMEKAERGEEIDINSEAVISDIINDVSKQSGIKELLSNDQGVEVLFKGNMNAIKETIKDKTASVNNFAKAEMAKNLQLTGDEFDIVKESIIEVAKESASSDGEVDMTTLDQEKIFAKVQDKLSSVPNDSSSTKQQESSRKGTKTDKVETNVDQILEKSKINTYKKAINTLLADTKTDPTESVPLKVNVKRKNSESKIDSILNLQTGVNPLQIRDRAMTENVTSRKVDFISKSQLKESKPEAKRSMRRKMFDLLDSYASTAINSPESNETVQDVSSEEKTPIAKKVKKMSVQQKLDQAVAAIDTIIPSTEETKPVRDTMIQTLLDMAEMQQEMITANEYAQENFSAKIKGKQKPKYLSAIQELSEARTEKNRIEIAELKTGKKVSSETKNKAKLDVLKAENKLAQAGPVQDVVKASQDIVAELKKRR